MSQGRSIGFFLACSKHDTLWRELSGTHYLIKRDFR